MKQDLLHYATVLLIVASVVLAGCSQRYSDLPVYNPFGFEDYPNKSVGRFKTSYVATQIDKYFEGTDPGPIGITTFVDLNDFYSTSSFGRVFAEQLVTELSLLGYDIVELRQSEVLQYFEGEGEFMLSRDARRVKKGRNLGGLIVGTYTASPERVYVNARLVHPGTSMIMSAASAEMSMTDELKKMLRKGQARKSLERIPVQGFRTVSTPIFDVPSKNRHPYLTQKEQVTENRKKLPKGILPNSMGVKK